jgi:long-subunit acyl-CoA synthetase (AMP-forming)
MLLFARYTQQVSFVGGAATPLEVLSFFENIGVQICEGYGLTETRYEQ